MKKLYQALQHFTELLYPKLCGACGLHLLENETVLCVYCRALLPFSNESHDPDNSTEKLFWGNVPVEAAATLLFFNKSARTQVLLHQLKYHQRFEIGEMLGELFAQALVHSGRFDAINMIIPVPLHPERAKFRGYNQSAVIANSMASILKVPVANKLLLRKINTESQTKKNRIERFDNMECVFSVASPDEVKGQNILIIDDVITTGATLISSAQALHQAGSNDLFIGPIAKA